MDYTTGKAGDGMTFSTPHKIFTDENAGQTRLNGSRLEAYNASPQAARSLCAICGDDVINDDWPTGQWRHMTPAEVAQYGTVPAGGQQ